MPAPWRDRDRLPSLLAAWRGRAAGRALFRLDTGPGWVSLHLEGEDRPALFLGALPGAVLVFPHAGPLPRPLRDALQPVRRDPLHHLLRDARLTGADLLRDDLVVVLDLATAAGARELRLQLFGSRGGCVLLDPAAGRMLWTAHAGPHPCLVAPAPARAADAPPAPLDAVDAWAAAGLDHLARQQLAALADHLERGLQRRLDAAARLVENLARDLDRADGGEARRREAETLAAGLHVVSRGQAEVTLPDPRDGTPHTLQLDPALPPHANLDRLFHQARKAERGREVVAMRLADARAQLAARQEARATLRALLAADGPADDPAPLLRLASLQAFAAAHAHLLAERPGDAGRDAGRAAGRAPDQPARSFRRYRIDGRWEVWIGRSSEENDLLTHRASHPRDLWLHAQAVAGSHVILRTGGRPDTVPRGVLEKAAALAAQHSKARHSALVPVIWTERRYVRRPRKAPPGTAVCLQEQNLFVEPGVMAGVEPA